MLLPNLQHSGLTAAGVSVERKSVFVGPVPLHRPSSGLLRAQWERIHSSSSSGVFTTATAPASSSAPGGA